MMQRFHTLKVQIAIPSTGLWMADFGTSLANLIGAVSLFRIGDYKHQLISISNVKGSILSRSRFLAVEEAKQKNVDYLLFIDSDQTFPRKMLHQLILRDVDVVAANVATKVLPAQPTARNRGPKYAQDPKDWVPVYTDPSSEGLERVDRVGTGIMLLSRNAFSKLKPEDWNVFWRPEVEQHQGEDWTMTDALEALKIPLYIDHDLSQQVGHIGFFTYTHEWVGDVLTPEQFKERTQSVRDPEPRPIAKALAAM